MSIYVESEEEVYPTHIAVREGRIPCFLCGERIGKTAIHWMGAAGVSKDDAHDVYFHPCCAVSFVRRLMEDIERYFTNDPKTPLQNIPTKSHK